MVSVGYAPNNVHGLQSKSHQLERTINVTDILRFSPWAQAALRRGTFMARRTAPEISSRQKCVEANVSRCFVCHAYMSSPRSCVRDVADSARSIFFDQAYNARTDSSCKGPSLQDIVGVTPEIELAAEALKRNLGLTEPYAAIQYRAGPDRRGHDVEHNSAICYGPKTIEKALQKMSWERLPRFWLSNAVGYNTEAAFTQHPKPPSAIRLAVEALVAARAHVLLLNPGSTIPSLVLRLRRAENRPIKNATRFVGANEVVDACTCNSIDANSRLQQQYYHRFCSRPDEFSRPPPHELPASKAFANPQKFLTKLLGKAR